MGKRKYVIGSKLVVTSRLYGHHFQLGEIVQVTYVDDDSYPSYCCIGMQGNCWWLNHDEVSPCRESTRKIKDWDLRKHLLGIKDG